MAVKNSKLQFHPQKQFAIFDFTLSFLTLRFTFYIYPAQSKLMMESAKSDKTNSCLY